MQTLLAKARPFVGSRSFYAGALGVMAPVAVQQLINNLFNMIDNLMVGSLDASGLAMSAVTVANRPYTIFFGVFFGMTGAAGLLISQYYGARDVKTCRALFALQLVIGLAASLCVGLWLALWPESVMRIFVNDPRTISLGMEYLSIIWLSYLPLAVSNVCIFSLRSIGENRMSMLVSLAAMGVNALCNYALIFGRLGMPALGVRVDDESRQVVAVFEQEEIMDQLKTVREWYNEGIINADAANTAEGPTYKACFLAQGWSGAAKTTWGPNMGKELVAYQYGPTILSNDSVLGSCNFISVNSEHPDKALAFLNLMNTDSKVRDAFYYGLEGDNFTYTADGRVHKERDGWGMAGYTQGTFFNVSLLDDAEFNQWDEVHALNDAANPSVLLGFSFDTSKVNDQITNCKSIWDRYHPELLTGTVDPEQAVKDMYEEMRAEGFDDIVAEAQAQVNAFLGK